MIPGLRIGLLAAAVVWPGLGSSGAAEIEGLTPVIRDDGIRVSFRVEDAFEEDIAHDIETGLDVTFRYNVELKRARGLWFDATLASRVIRTTVTYDNLTKRYSLTRSIDGEIDRTEVVADVAAMRRFMTEFEALRLFDVAGLMPNEEYRLRVKGVMKEGSLALLIPWDSGAGWREARFRYVP